MRKVSQSLFWEDPRPGLARTFFFLCAELLLLRSECLAGFQCFSHPQWTALIKYWRSFLHMCCVNRRCVSSAPPVFTGSVKFLDVKTTILFDFCSVCTWNFLGVFFFFFLCLFAITFMLHTWENVFSSVNKRLMEYRTRQLCCCPLLW